MWNSVSHPVWFFPSQSFRGTKLKTPKITIKPVKLQNNIKCIYYYHLPLPSLLLLLLLVAFNIISMSCFKLVSASSSSSSSSSTKLARRSVAKDREGGLAADLPGGDSTREVTRRRRRRRSEQYQVNWHCLDGLTGKSDHWYRVFHTIWRCNFSIWLSQNLNCNNAFRFDGLFFQFGFSYRNLTYVRSNYVPDGIFFHLFHVIFLSFIYYSIN